MLCSLDDDIMVQVLGHLPPEGLAHYVCVSRETKAVGQRDECWASHLEKLCAQYSTAESQELVDQHAPRAPEYEGPRPRMPYLTPWSQAEVDKRHEALRALPIDDPRRPNWRDNEGWAFPRWRVTGGVSQYQCYPPSEAKLCPLQRTSVWVPHAFPKMRCCGVEISSLAAFEAHASSWRHYETTQFGNGIELPQSELRTIDPRKLDGEAAFEALPKYEAFSRMKRYVRYYEYGIERHADADSWSENDRKKMESLAEFARESFADRYPGQYHDTDDDDPLDVEASDIANAIVDSALSGFREVGPYAEVPGIPYSSVLDVCFGGLACCDPCGGSSSTQTFMETVRGFV